MSIEDDIAFLASVPTLSLLGGEALRIVAIGADSRFLDEGEVLFREGEKADGAYVVHVGTIRLVSERDAPGLEPMTVGSGALLGELALFTETTRPVTATAHESSVVLRIPRSLFLRMLEGFPETARRLRETMAARAVQIMRDVHGVREVFDVSEPEQ
jgi:CRP-like cAMP-binding protein